MSGTTSNMMGMGAAGTGYGGSSGNSLMQQLVLRALMSGNTGGGVGSTFSPSSPLSGSIPNNPLSGLLMPQQRTGAMMNPQVTAPQTQLQGTNTGLSNTLGGSNLQSLLQVLQNQQKAQNTQPGASLNPGVLSGLWGNLTGQYTGASPQALLSGPNAVSTPQSIQSALGLSSNQYVP